MSNDGASRYEPGDDSRPPDDARTNPRVAGDAFADRASQTVETFGQGQLIPMAPRWATAACGSGQQQWIVIQPQVPYPYSFGQRMSRRMQRGPARREARAPPPPQSRNSEHSSESRRRNTEQPLSSDQESNNSWAFGNRWLRRDFSGSCVETAPRRWCGSDGRLGDVRPPAQATLQSASQRSSKRNHPATARMERPILAPSTATSTFLSEWVPSERAGPPADQQRSGTTAPCGDKKKRKQETVSKNTKKKAPIASSKSVDNLDDRFGKLSVSSSAMVARPARSEQRLWVFDGCDYAAFRQRFLAAADANRWDDGMKYRMLWDAMGDNVEARLALVNKDTATFEVLLTIMDELFAVHESHDDAIQEAASMQRRTDETPEQFAEAIEKALERANLSESDKNRAARKYFVQGLTDERERMYIEREDKSGRFENVVRLAIIWESLTQTMEHLRRENDTLRNCMFVMEFRLRTKKTKPSP